MAAADHAAHKIRGESVTIKALSQFNGASQYNSTAHAARSRSIGDQPHHKAQPTPKGSKVAGRRTAQVASPSSARAPAIHQATMGGWS